MLLAANWKMNKTSAEAVEFVLEYARGLQGSQVPTVLCAPFTCLSSMQKIWSEENFLRSRLSYGGQNFYFEESGAFTGEISAAMLLDLHCDYVIAGHSERRAIFGESDELISKKVRKAIDKKLIPIFCIGETLKQRESGELEAVLTKQIEMGLSETTSAEFDKFVVAYEPVWAIGTGVVATPLQAEQAHEFVRTVLAGKFGGSSEQIPILYGGSVTPQNAYDLVSQKNIDGALVGGASLKAQSLLQLHEACLKAVDEEKSVR